MSGCGQDHGADDRPARLGIAAVESTFRPVLALMSGRTVGFVASFLIPRGAGPDPRPGRVRHVQAALPGRGHALRRRPARDGREPLLLPAHGPARPRRRGLRGQRGGGARARRASRASSPLRSCGGRAVALARQPGARAPHHGARRLRLPDDRGLGGLEIVMVARKRYPLASWAYAALDLARAGLLVAPALVFSGLSWLLAGAVAFAAIRCGARAPVPAAGSSTARALALTPGSSASQLAYALPFALAGLVEIVQANFHQYFVAYRTSTRPRSPSTRSGVCRSRSSRSPRPRCST